MTTAKCRGEQVASRLQKEFTDRDDGAGFRVLLEQFGDGRLKGIELAGTLTANSSGRRSSEVPR